MIQITECDPARPAHEALLTVPRTSALDDSNTPTLATLNFDRESFQILRKYQYLLSNSLKRFLTYDEWLFR